MVKKKKKIPKTTVVQPVAFGLFLCLQDSLAAEIEGTMRRELSVEEESAFQDQRYNNQI